MKQLQKPKLLPWLARKAGISDNRAEMLWNKALALAKSKKRQAVEGHYMAEAMQQMLALLEQEKAAQQHEPRPLKIAGNKATATFTVLFGRRTGPAGCVAR
jgi:hypothetical protein